MNHMYLPVKVLDRQWADELMQGHVYMRALEDFGGWRIMEGGAMGGEDLNNDFRGDVAEGFVKNLAPEEPDPIFDNFPQDFKDAMLQRGFIDDAERETRIFSMTRLMYDAETKSYEKLPAELSQFGDTAVIITDPAAFYQRVVAFYHRLYETSFVVEMGEITYKDIFRDYGDWGLYTKVKKYSWQQEVRIAARLRPDIQNLRTEKPQPITADIGDLGDIAIEVPLQELLDGRWCPELLEEDLITRIKQCKTPPDGLTDDTWFIPGDFREIGPYEKWIDFWRKQLPLENWTAVTRMESLSGGTVPLPRLEFIEKNGGGRLVFHYNAIELHEERIVCGETDIRERLLETLEQQFAGRYMALEYACNLKLGEVSEKYDEKGMISDSFGRSRAGMKCVYRMEKSGIRYRNIFGMDVGEPCWKMMLQCQNSIQMNTPLFVAYVQKIVQETVDAMDGEGDVYEKYHSL